MREVEQKHVSALAMTVSNEVAIVTNLIKEPPEQEIIISKNNSVLNPNLGLEFNTLPTHKLAFLQHQAFLTSTYTALW